MSGAKLYPVGVIRSAIKFAREAWRGEDGAEGDTVHLLCNELEHRLGQEEPRKRCEHDNYQSITGLCVAYDRWCNVCGALRLTTEHKWLLSEMATNFIREGNL